MGLRFHRLKRHGLSGSTRFLSSSSAPASSARARRSRSELEMTEVCSRVLESTACAALRESKAHDPVLGTCSARLAESRWQWAPIPAQIRSTPARCRRAPRFLKEPEPRRISRRARAVDTDRQAGDAHGPKEDLRRCVPGRPCGKARTSTSRACRSRRAAEDAGPSSPGTDGDARAAQRVRTSYLPPAGDRPEQAHHEMAASPGRAIDFREHSELGRASPSLCGRAGCHPATYSPPSPHP